MPLRLLVLGATGKTGTHILDLALARGHQVTAFVRSPQKIARRHPALAIVQGDPLQVNQLAAALPGHHAVLSAIGPSGREAFRPSTLLEEHRRLLEAFLQAASGGDIQGVVQLLAEDAIMVTDGGAEGRRFAGQRNLPQPLQGSARIAAFVVATTQRTAGVLRVEEHQLNGQPAAVFWNGDQPFAALLLAVADGKVQRVYFHADLHRLGRLGRQVDKGLNLSRMWPSPRG